MDENCVAMLMLQDKDNESLFFMLELMRNVIHMWCVCMLFVDVCSFVEGFTTTTTTTKKHLILYEENNKQKSSDALVGWKLEYEYLCRFHDRYCVIHVHVYFWIVSVMTSLLSQTFLLIGLPNNLNNNTLYHKGVFLW